MKTHQFFKASSLGRIVVEEGDVFRFEVNVGTRAGHIHKVGSTLKVLERTSETPHREVGPYNVNWRCETVYGISVWATLETCIERGLLARISSSKGSAAPTPTIWERILDP